MKHKISGWCPWRDSFVKFHGFYEGISIHWLVCFTPKPKIDHVSVYYIYIYMYYINCIYKDPSYEPQYLSLPYKLTNISHKYMFIPQVKGSLDNKIGSLLKSTHGGILKWLVNLPPPNVPPSDSKGFFLAGLILGNQWVFISHAHRRGYALLEGSSHLVSS